jgi:hypothetical protein
MAQGDTREGKRRGNWRMEWVSSTLHTTSEYGVSSITTADAHTSAPSSRLNWRPCRFKLRVCFAERRNLVSARVPSHFKGSLPSLVMNCLPSNKEYRIVKYTSQPCCFLVLILQMSEKWKWYCWLCHTTLWPIGNPRQRELQTLNTLTYLLQINYIYF